MAISTDPLDIEVKKVLLQPLPSANDGQYTLWSHDVLNIVVKRVVGSEFKKYWSVNQFIRFQAETSTSVQESPEQYGLQQQYW